MWQGGRDELTSCGEHGKCRESDGKCECDRGYKGSLCQNRVCPLDCDLRHSTCNLIVGSCDCDYGWEGKRCTTPSPMVPSNGGSSPSQTDMFGQVYQENSLREAAAREGEDSALIQKYLNRLANRRHGLRHDSKYFSRSLCLMLLVLLTRHFINIVCFRFYISFRSQSNGQEGERRERGSFDQGGAAKSESGR
jgi:hypothetical protein